jgi:hypothetical protein
MKKKGAAPGFSSKWWNDECREAASALANAPEEERTRLGRELKKVVRIAKRDWANSYITEANIWEVAAWRHGRRSSHIPALIDHTGELTYDHEQMASLLSERFFAKDEGNIPTHFTDDPPPRTPRQFAPFGKEELLDLLKQTSNKSAPGISGIGWDLLKRGWPHCDDLLTNIYSACIRLGHHPIRWKEATVVVIPKPNKPDYSLAKAHRPISLLETLSKLMEKAVAKRFQYDIVKEGLIDTNQFGGRTHSSCLDAGLTLIHDVQAAHAAGLKAGILLFDVKGFFDNVNHARMTARLTQHGLRERIGRMGIVVSGRKKNQTPLQQHPCRRTNTTSWGSPRLTTIPSPVHCLHSSATEQDGKLEQLLTRNVRGRRLTLRMRRRMG